MIHKVLTALLLACLSLAPAATLAACEDLDDVARRLKQLKLARQTTFVSHQGYILVFFVEAAAKDGRWAVAQVRPSGCAYVVDVGEYHVRPRAPYR